METVSGGTQLKWRFGAWVKLSPVFGEEEVEASFKAKLDPEITIKFDSSDESALLSGTVTVVGHDVGGTRSKLESDLDACEEVLSSELQLFVPIEKDLTELPTAERYAAARAAGKGRFASLRDTALSLCPLCRGTGATNGDYCECAVGDERRRLGPPPGE
jgi:hypothetical protein